MPRPSIEHIFHEARAMDAAQREAYLKGACGDDVAFRAKIDGLLRADADAGTFMAAIEPTAESGGTVAGPPRERTGEQVGRYKLLQQIGEGGFGTVWMAEQREPVRRRVALKIIKLGMDTKQVIARFEAERQALAMMDHPNIAKVLDAGATPTGRPFFVMELIKGVPILDYCDTEKLDTKERLDLFTKVCHAIQHAHQKGIIHRDIKPSNVMITMHDGVPVPKVIDFGVAKATNQELTEKTLFTQHRQMIGTPAYMSPEQAEMSGLDVDTRSDIYSLGVLLYELLTGTTPFDSDELMSKGFAEMMRLIREVEPHKPSTRLSTLGETATRTARQRHVADPKKLGLLLRGDLDWIVMKCLEKDRTRRYETANGLAADLKRHLRDEPVLAGPPGGVYRLRKFVRRNRTGVMAATVVSVGLLLAVSVVIVAIVQMSHERDRARDAEAKSRALRVLFGGGQVSLAILPLENRSVDPEDDYLADGVTTFLTSDLHRISALRLMSEQSVRSALHQTGSGASLRAVADELNVQGVLTGSVERRDDRIYLTIQLVHVLTNQNLWERAYDEVFENLQAMQNAVSRDIVAELQLELTPEERVRLATARAIDPEAQAACLKGYRVMQGLTKETLTQALEYFDEAIAIDSEYAAAHAGRAFAWVRMVEFSAPNETMPQAKDAAFRAIELDDTLAEAHDAAGIVTFRYDWDWQAAEEHFKAAIELDPDSSGPYVSYALYLASMNRSEESLRHLDLALEVDPFALVNTGDGIMMAAFMNREYELTAFYCEEALKLKRDVWVFYAWLGLALAQSGEFDRAIEAAEEGSRIVLDEYGRNPDDIPSPFVFAALGGVYALAGHEAEARAALARNLELSKFRYGCPYETATVHLALNELDEAFAKLHEAIDIRSDCIPWLGVDPRLEPVRSSERFIELLDRDERVRNLLYRTGWTSRQ